MGKVCIVAGNIKKDIERKLNKMNLDIIKTRKNEKVYESISYHPDIVMTVLDNKNIIVAPEEYEYYKHEFQKRDKSVNIIKGNKKLGSIYPNTIPYNLAIVGEHAFHNYKYTDEVLKKYITEKNIKKINIQQGYSKCSIAIIDSNSIITSDRKIYEYSRKHKIESLLIKPGYIDLKGEEYGFIGGCTGVLSDDKILISGNFLKHPEKERIENFIKSRKKDIIYLSTRNIIDIGTIFII